MYNIKYKNNFLFLEYDTIGRPVGGWDFDNTFCIDCGQYFWTIKGSDMCPACGKDASGNINPMFQLAKRNRRIKKKLKRILK